MRQLRAEARLTQEELAEAAGLSPRSVSDLERGINRTARKDTAVLLADAFGMAGPVRQVFVAAARGKAEPGEVLEARNGARAFAAATRGLPRDVTIFTGRGAELARLVETLSAAAGNGGVIGIHAIGGMAGVGKTAFAVHAAHKLARAYPDGQFFLPLHAHTAGQRPVDPADALASLLLSAGVPASQIAPGLTGRAAQWRDHVADRSILLLLDDAAGHDQVRPLLPGTGTSLVLVTSRRRLAALPDAGTISLDTLPPGDAAELLARLAERPDLTADSSAALEIARLCGGLPLAIGMLASRPRHHPARTAAGFAADLATARDRLSLMRAEDVTVTAAFDLSYQELSAEQQRLFGLPGLVPGPGTDAYAAAALADIGVDQAGRLLDELYDQHLLSEADAGRYEMHDLVREHARALAAARDPTDSGAATTRLLDYYLHTVLAAGQHFASAISAYHRPVGGSSPAHAPDLSTLSQSAAWLESGRPNLHAAASYAAATGHDRHAIQIPGALSGFLAARGLFDQSAALLPIALTAARQVGDGVGEADPPREVGFAQEDKGDHQQALVSLARAVAAYQDAGDRSYLTQTLIELGYARTMTGDYPGATASLQQALELARFAGDRLAEANALAYVGFVPQLTASRAVLRSSGWSRSPWPPAAQACMHPRGCPLAASDAHASRRYFQAFFIAERLASVYS